MGILAVVTQLRCALLAVVPARGGSKGIPRKNLQLLGGQPLVALAVEAGRAARLVSRVLCSTTISKLPMPRARLAPKSRSCVRPSSPATLPKTGPSSCTRSTSSSAKEQLAARHRRQLAANLAFATPESRRRRHSVCSWTPAPTRSRLSAWRDSTRTRCGCASPTATSSHFSTRHSGSLAARTCRAPNFRTSTGRTAWSMSRGAKVILEQKDDHWPTRCGLVTEPADSIDIDTPRTWLWPSSSWRNARPGVMKALVVGLGSIGRRHARNWSALGLGPVVVCHQTYDLDAVLSSERPDVVLRHQSDQSARGHRVQGITCRRACFDRKAHRTSAARSRELLEAANHTRRVLMVGYNLPFSPWPRAASKSWSSSVPSARSSARALRWASTCLTGIPGRITVAATVADASSAAAPC